MRLDLLFLEGNLGSFRGVGGRGQRVKQALFMYLGGDFMRELRDLNRGSNIMPSHSRGAYGFGMRGLGISWDEDPDLWSFVRGVKPVWLCDHQYCDEVKSLPEVRDLFDRQLVSWVAADLPSMPNYHGVYFYWVKFESTVLEAVYRIRDLILMRDGVKDEDLSESGKARKHCGLQIAISYILGMIFGYNEEQVFDHINRMCGLESWEQYYAEL